MAKQIREQLRLDFYETSLSRPKDNGLERIGTFQDSLRAPVHRWFKYPAGYSYKLVHTLSEDCRLTERNWILDPFVGCGTTSVAAKERGVNSVGIEAHPFVHWVASVKTYWEYDLGALHRLIQSLLSELHKRLNEPLAEEDLDQFPALLHKCYSAGNLAKLKIIRDTIETYPCSEAEQNFFRLALTDTLRTASSAGTGWPYIAPSKYHAKQERDALEAFAEQVLLMYEDVKKVRSLRRSEVEARLLLMDAREAYPLEVESMDLAVTSPPYLNNYDYADRTRLEMYFWGWAKTWGEITEKVRDKLIIAATTQIRRGSFSEMPLDPEMASLDTQVHAELSAKIEDLKHRRLEKGGKKSYDLMVAGYFNDMTQVMKQVYRVLKPDAPFVLVLGDSAPYGIYVPTEEYLGKIALGIGFSRFRVQPLRGRGDKWGHNTQPRQSQLDLYCTYPIASTIQQCA